MLGFYAMNVSCNCVDDRWQKVLVQDLQEGSSEHVSLLDHETGNLYKLFDSDEVRASSYCRDVAIKVALATAVVFAVAFLKMGYYLLKMPTHFLLSNTESALIKREGRIVATSLFYGALCFLSGVKGLVQFFSNKKHILTASAQFAHFEAKWLLANYREDMRYFFQDEIRWGKVRAFFIGWCFQPRGSLEDTLEGKALRWKVVKPLSF